MIRVLFMVFVALNSWASPSEFNVQDKASLQRGAKLYMNYCSGCHSLQYLRYRRMAADLGLTNIRGQVDAALVKNNLIFTQAALDDPILTALPAEDAKQWFGLMPPDLSLTARVRGADWIYEYLTSFYKDTSRPFGVNNLLIPEVAMPNSLEPLLGEFSQEELQLLYKDLVTFLVYASEPAQLVRYRLGAFVLGFLSIFLLFVYGLKRIYWRNIK